MSSWQTADHFTVHNNLSSLSLYCTLHTDTRTLYQPYTYCYTTTSHHCHFTVHNIPTHGHSTSRIRIVTQRPLITVTLLYTTYSHTDTLPAVYVLLHNDLSSLSLYCTQHTHTRTLYQPYTYCYTTTSHHCHFTVHNIPTHGHSTSRIRIVIQRPLITVTLLYTTYSHTDTLPAVYVLLHNDLSSLSLYCTQHTHTRTLYQPYTYCYTTTSHHCHFTVHNILTHGHSTSRIRIVTQQPLITVTLLYTTYSHTDTLPAEIPLLTGEYIPVEPTLGTAKPDVSVVIPFGCPGVAHH
ncbi:hypothetical protein J6590_062198 [Homalodisca vitripennis]|nr:hypothetical protein J6590_062198 [Homalodisca vitripennis]